MSHFIFELTNKKGNNTATFLSTRKLVKGTLYCARVTTSDLSGAKIFNTKTAALNSAKQAGVTGKIFPVSLVISYEAANEK